MLRLWKIQLVKLRHYKVTKHQESGFEAHSLIASIRELKDACFPVHFNHGFPSFMGVEVSNLPKVVLITIPKSGIYLMGAYLKRVGLISSGAHLDDVRFSDYRDKEISQMVGSYKNFWKIYLFGKSIKLLRPRVFSLGYVGFNSQNISDLAGVNVVFATCEIRAVMVPIMRCLSRSARSEDSHGKSIESNQERPVALVHESDHHLVGWFNAIAGRSDDQHALAVLLEDLTSSGCACQLAMRVGINMAPEQANEMLDDVPDMPTKTWSGKRVELQEFGSDEAEVLFREIGGIELNSRLGYPLL